MTRTAVRPHEGQQGAGTMLRDWRQRRRVSQLDLASRAGVSARHLSFVETGRSRPSSAMLLRLADQLAMPLREQNRLLLAGGHAPVHPEHGLDEPAMADVHAAVEAILAAHLPYPALVVDQGWELVAANEAIWGLLDGLDVDVLEPPVNVIRLSLHPRGLAPRIVNLEEWRDHLRHRLQREYDATGDPRLGQLLAEVGPGSSVPPAGGALVVPLQLRAGEHVLSLLSTTTIFGTPREVTVSELAIEAFYPADAASRALLTASPTES